MDILVFVGWVVGIVINAMIAGEKNRSVGGAIAASILLTPLFIYLYLLAVPVKIVAAKTNKVD